MSVSGRAAVSPSFRTFCLERMISENANVRAGCFWDFGGSNEKCFWELVVSCVDCVGIATKSKQPPQHRIGILTNAIAIGIITPVVAPNARINHPNNPPEPAICVASSVTTLLGIGGGGIGIACSDEEGMWTGFPQSGFGHLLGLPALSSFAEIVFPQCGQLNRIISIPCSLDHWRLTKQVRSRTKKRNVETKTVPSTPAKGPTDQHLARRSLSGAWAQGCVCKRKNPKVQLAVFEGNSNLTLTRLLNCHHEIREVLRWVR